MEAKFKIGQKVRVLPFNAIKLDIRYDTTDHVGFAFSMKKYCGNVYRISGCDRYNSRNIYTLDILSEEQSWNFEERWLQEVNDDET